MKMKKILLAAVLSLFSLCVFAKDYSMTITQTVNKAGGKSALHVPITEAKLELLLDGTLKLRYDFMMDTVIDPKITYKRILDCIIEFPHDISYKITDFAGIAAFENEEETLPALIQHKNDIEFFIPIKTLSNVDCFIELQLLIPEESYKSLDIPVRMNFAGYQDRSGILDVSLGAYGFAINSFLAYRKSNAIKKETQIEDKMKVLKSKYKEIDLFNSLERYKVYSTKAQN